MSGYRPHYLEGYDHGIAVPACYLLSFVDDDGNVFIIDGYYQAERQIAEIAQNIHTLREDYEVEHDGLGPIYADPAVFKRTGQGGQSGRGVGTTVAAMFSENDIAMQRGANDIAGGIAKVRGYLSVDVRHEHPLSGLKPAPRLFISEKCQFIINEMTEYYWKRDTHDAVTDTPTDRNDHAMDAMKYLLTPRPRLASFVGKPNEEPAYLKWHEIERENNTTLPRHR